MAHTNGRLTDLQLSLYREPAPAWPANGRPHLRHQGRHFEAEAVLLADGHAVRLVSGDRVLVEIVRPGTPASPPAAVVDLGAVPAGGFFSNDRLLFRNDHEVRTYPTDAAFAAAAAEAQATLAAGGATVVPASPAEPQAPMLAMRVGEHEVEVRAVYREPARRRLVRVTSRLGLKLKFRR